MNGRGHGELPLDPDLPREPTEGSSREGLPLHLTPSALALVAAGGTAGTGARYAVSKIIPSVDGWPLAILTVNLVGAFVLGLTLEALARRGADQGRRRRLRLLLGTGFCGAFTTYSALAVDVDLLLGDGRATAAVVYALVTVIVGFLASTLGIWVAARTHPGTADPVGEAS